MIRASVATWPLVNTDLSVLEKDLTTLMPHRAPMLLLDRLESFSHEGARGVVDICEGNPFLRSDGVLERVAYAEILAQCFAAGAGALQSQSGQKAATLGYLAALRDIAVHADAKLGQRLVAEVRVAARLGGVTVVDGEVRANGLLLASGQFKVFIPQEEI